MSERPLVNVHIEKTAGRSLRSVLIDSFGPDQVLTYDPVEDSLLRASARVIATEKQDQEMLERLVSNRVLIPLARLSLKAAKSIERRRAFGPEDLPEDFSVITGHFAANRFSDFLPPEAADYISVLRDPLARMLSHYEHWKRTRGTAHFRVETPYNQDLTFKQFALLPELQNYQWQAVFYDSDQYRLLGTVDEIDSFMEELGLIPPTAEAPHLNKANYISPALSAKFRHQFKEFHSEDYELYETIARRWQ